MKIENAFTSKKKLVDLSTYSKNRENGKIGGMVRAQNMKGQAVHWMGEADKKKREVKNAKA